MDSNIIGEIFLAAKEIARQLSIAEDGYRVVSNCGGKGWPNRNAFTLSFNRWKILDLASRLIKSNIF